MDKIEKILAKRRNINEELFDCEQDERRLNDFSDFLAYHVHGSVVFIEELKENYQEGELFSLLEETSHRTKMASYQMMDELEDAHRSIKVEKAALTEKENELALEQRRLIIAEKENTLSNKYEVKDA
ncbi:DUF3958 family protein [Enterococcus sp. BWR-S5]|uniref:DUF3958 family protein n=1 Tax=Enterococcus sp. BWR-S5 TaxID=2787714 RepID=UPI001923AE92|nr:DUF3958 family protein [Enterococcus sp. BWR-S5]MBL1223596.1 DUF3958 family protein [Enterococcus sp. BWR-S5]